MYPKLNNKSDRTCQSVDTTEIVNVTAEIVLLIIVAMLFIVLRFVLIWANGIVSFAPRKIIDRQQPGHFQTWCDPFCILINSQFFSIKNFSQSLTFTGL
jgi:hypothetical protein